jgi:hypothetical protein
MNYLDQQRRIIVLLAVDWDLQQELNREDLLQTRVILAKPIGK